MFVWKILNFYQKHVVYCLFQIHLVECWMTLELCKTIAMEVSFDGHTIGLCPQTQVRAFPLELAQKLELESYNVRVWNIFTFIEMIYPQTWKKKHSWKASKTAGQECAPENSEFCFPRFSMENIKIRGKQNKLFPEGPVTLYI